MGITVLQWNVWFEESIERVLAVLREHPADIICLQELTKDYIGQSRENTWEFLAEQLGYHVYHKDLPIITPDGRWSQANAIFSKFPITASRFRWINEPANNEGYDDQYRAYVEVVVEPAGQPITIATTHMSYTDQFNVTARKRQELATLLEIIDGVTGPYIFAGDLNAQPDSPTVTELSKRLQHAGPDFEQKTWTTKPFEYKDFKADRLDWRLDYIFCRNLKPITAQIIATDVSDHLPVTASLQLT